MRCVGNQADILTISLKDKELVKQNAASSAFDFKISATTNLGALVESVTVAHHGAEGSKTGSNIDATAPKREGVLY